MSRKKHYFEVWVPEIYIARWRVEAIDLDEAREKGNMGDGEELGFEHHSNLEQFLEEGDNPGPNPVSTRALRR